MLWLCFFPTTEAEVALAEQRYPAFPYEIDKAIPEVVHRYFAAALGLLAIFIVYLTHRTEDKQNKRISIFLLIFICCQGLFGYLTVSLKLLPIIVTTHLFGGFITLSTFFYLYIKNSNFFKNFQIGHLKNLAMFALFVLVIQIFLGAWTQQIMHHWHVLIFQLAKVVLYQIWIFQLDLILLKRSDQIIFMAF